MEKILKIEEYCDIDRQIEMNGYRIVTDNQTIKMVINNNSLCCEDVGYYWTEDNADDFIGAELLDVKIVDSSLKPESLIDLFYGDAVFVNIETDRGVLQFTIYNSQNGYYSHSVLIRSNQVSLETEI